MSSLTVDELKHLLGIPVFTADGEKIGHVGTHWFDEDTGRVEYIGVEGDALGVSRRVVPAHGAQRREDGVYLPYSRAQIEGAPVTEGDEIAPEYDEQLRSHYAPADADQPITRSEEELRVGIQPVEAGRVRLRKWVETQPVELDVELQRETARVVRQPIDQPVDEAALGEQEIEVPLHAERPVVQKQTVAKEQIGIEKGVETERQTVRDEVRKEHVELEDDTPR